MVLWWWRPHSPAQRTQVVLDESHEGLNYEEDSALSNLKLVVGFAGVGASLVSHVYPAPFPKNWLVLLLCCAWCALPPAVPP